MPLKLMYITNSAEVAKIAEAAGVDRIFVDMEYIGKDLRQGGLDSVQNHHTLDDIRVIKDAVSEAKVLVRVNPIHDRSERWSDSGTEIDAAIDAGADILMLPYFKTADEVRQFVEYVDGRAVTMPLVETPEAAERIDEIIAVPGIDEIYVGLNDLSLGYGMKFMFQLLADGTVERLALKFRQAGIPFGFGGIAAIGTGTLPAEVILKEHYRLGSSCVILSRSFCNCDRIQDLDRIRDIFDVGLRSMRAFEQEIALHSAYFDENRRRLRGCVDKIIG